MNWGGCLDGGGVLAAARTRERGEGKGLREGGRDLNFCVQPWVRFFGKKRCKSVQTKNNYEQYDGGYMPR